MQNRRLPVPSLRAPGKGLLKVSSTAKVCLVPSKGLLKVSTAKVCVCVVCVCVCVCVFRCLAVCLFVHAGVCCMCAGVSVVCVHKRETILFAV